MKKVIVLVLVAFISVTSFAQSGSAERDSVAQTTAFQIKVKMAAHKAAGQILADTLALDRVRQFAQIIISDPTGVTANWLQLLSYQVMTNPAVNYDSPDDAFEYTMSTIFYKTAYAYYKEQQPTPYREVLLREKKKLEMQQVN